MIDASPVRWAPDPSLINDCGAALKYLFKNRHHFAVEKGGHHNRQLEALVRIGALEWSDEDEGYQLTDQVPPVQTVLDRWFGDGVQFITVSNPRFGAVWRDGTPIASPYKRDQVTHLYRVAYRAFARAVQ